MMTRLFPVSYTHLDVYKRQVMGIGIATIVRILLFLAILGVVVETSTSPATTLDASNPAADAFLQGAGQIGYRFFGLVLLLSLIHIFPSKSLSISFISFMASIIATD